MLNEKLSPSNMPVSIFSSTAPSKGSSEIHQHGYKSISNVLIPTAECTLAEFLQIGLKQYKDNIEAAKQTLSSLPYIYYAGLSVSGRGIFAIIPIAATDHTQHKTYPPPHSLHSSHSSTNSLTPKCRECNRG